MDLTWVLRTLGSLVTIKISETKLQIKSIQDEYFLNKFVVTRTYIGIFPKKKVTCF